MYTENTWVLFFGGPQIHTFIPNFFADSCIFHQLICYSLDASRWKAHKALAVAVLWFFYSTCILPHWREAKKTTYSPTTESTSIQKKITLEENLDF